MRHCWLSEKASVSYEKFCSSSNTSHLFFTPSEMFSQPLFHLGPLQGVSRAGYRERKRKEIQALLTLWKNRPDLLPLDFQAVLSSQVLLPPEPLLPDETSTLLRKPSLQASPGNYYCCSFWSPPQTQTLAPTGSHCPQRVGVRGTKWRQSLWLGMREVSLWVPRAFTPPPQNSGCSTGEGGKKVEFYDTISIFFFKFTRRELPVLSRNVLPGF